VIDSIELVSHTPAIVFIRPLGGQTTATFLTSDFANTQELSKEERAVARALLLYAAEELNQ
jgi:hypothetical protein